MELLLYIGSGIAVVWGIAHLMPTLSVIRGFGDISTDNRRIITMEWVAEGVAIIFIGVLVFLVAGYAAADPSARRVVVASSVMLLAMALLTQLTGARTSIIAIKICPFVKTLMAVMFLVFIITTAG